MACFYPGQRVRIKPDPGTIPMYRNAEAVFLCYGTALVPRSRPGDDCCVRVLVQILSGPSDELEPILPEGLESDAEIAALYEPAEGLVSA